MARFYAPPERIRGGIALLGEDERRHMEVVRLRPGDRVELIDGKGNLYEGIVLRMGSGGAEVRIVGRRRQAPMRRVELYQGMPKGDKLELIIQKATELGASSVTPVICRRSIARIPKGKVGERLRRWRRIAIEAMKQCGRAYLMEVNPPMGFEEAVLKAEADLKLIAWEGERAMRFGEPFEGRCIGSVALLIGPEGGFEEEEVELARRAGFITVSLGELTLRCETAALAALILAQHHLGQLG